MTGSAALVARDLRRGWQAGGTVLPVAFLVLVASLFAFAVGPDPALLARIGGGVIWTAALLAALLPVDRLVAPDLDDGVIDQLRVRGASLAWVAAAKAVAHWLGFAPALLVAGLVTGALLGVPGARLAATLAGLLIGTPALAALAVATAALTAGLRGQGAVAGLMLLPLAVPLVIFGAGVIDGAPGAAQLLGAISLLLCAGAPPVAAAALRVASEARG